MKFYTGAKYWNRSWRKRGWSGYFGCGLSRQGPRWELWCTVFGLAFWLGRKPS